MSSNENDFNDDLDLSPSESSGSVPTGTNSSALPRANHTSVNCGGGGGLRSSMSGVRVDFVIVLGVASFFFALLFAVLYYNRRRQGQGGGGGSATQPRAMENSGRWRRKVAPAALPPMPDDAVIDPQVEEDALDETEHTAGAEEEEFADEENAQVAPVAVQL